MGGFLKLQTASFKTPRASPAGGLTVYEAFKEAVDRGWDKVAKEVFSVDPEGTKLVRVVPVSRSNGKEMKFYTIGAAAPLNRDADEIPVVNRSLGWSYEWQTYPFRLGAVVEKSAIEQDDVGFVAGLQSDLLNSAKLTIEYLIADHFNTAFGTGGALLLAADGGYYIDSDRPNPVAGAGTWSNLEADATSLTEDVLASAALNASQMVSPWGTVYPQVIKKLMIPAQFEVKMYRLLNTEKKLGGNDNDINWAASVFKMDDVIVYRWLNIPAVFYWLCDPKSEDNELVLRVRRQPEVSSGWGVENPDLFYLRVRFDVGLSLGDVRKSIRGGRIVAS